MRTTTDCVNSTISASLGDGAHLHAIMGEITQGVDAGAMSVILHLSCSSGAWCLTHQFLQASFISPHMALGCASTWDIECLCLLLSMFVQLKPDSLWVRRTNALSWRTSWRERGGAARRRQASQQVAQRMRRQPPQDMAEQLELAHAELEVRKQGFLWVTPCHERFLRCRVWRVLFPCCQPLDTCSLTSARTSSSRPFVYPSMDFGAELYSAGNLLLGSLAGEEHERIAVKSQHWG